MDADRNLLFGILALQMDLIQRDDLIRGMHAWVMEKTKSLAQVLQELGVLKLADRRILEPLVARHLQVHHNSPQESLAALSSVSSLQQDLQQIADPDIQASLAPLNRGSGTLPAPPRPAGGSRFRILRPHAKGGLGEVFVANDEELNREVALKEIQALHAFQPEFRSRFLLEAEITGGLEHPGIVPVYGLGSYADGRPFYAMRFIRGDSLQDAIRRFHEREKPGRDPRERSLALRELLGRFVDVCQAIAYAHSRGVLHRDLKPGNIMLGKYGETLVVDWGLAKASAQAASASRSVPAATKNEVQPETHGKTESDGATGCFAEGLLVPRSSTGPEAVTQMGQAVGTPAYMSPEQAAGRLDQLGPASDIYSLGATLYHLLTGAPSLATEDMGELLRRVQQGDIPPPRTVTTRVPAALDAVCRKAMAVQQVDRYASAQELAAEIERWLADEPVQAYREPWAVRGQRWLARHRTAATAAAVGTLIAFAALLIVLVLARAGEEREKTLREQEQTAKDEAIAAEQLAVTKAEDARRFLYTAHMNLAQQAWEIGNVHRVREILDLYRNPATKAGDARSWEWYFQDRLCESDLLTLKGHTKLATSAAFSPDGVKVASASGDHSVKLWDAATGMELRTFTGHLKGVTCLAFNRDGSKLASAGWDNTVKLWNVENGQILHTLAGHLDRIMGVSFSPDGARIASASGDNTVKVWDAINGRELFTLKSHFPNVTCVAFSPDGAILAAPGEDNTVKLWDATSGLELRTLKGHSSSVAGLAFSPNGAKIVSAGWDNTAKLWDTASGQELRTLKGHSGIVNSVAFSPDGARIASASHDRTIKLWDTASGQELRTIKGHSESVGCVAFSPDGARIVSAGDDNMVKLWDATGDLEQRTLLARFSWVTSAKFSPDGTRVASANHDHTVRLWDSASGQIMRVFKGHSGFVNNVAFSPDGTKIASASADKTVKLWEAANGRVLNTLTGHSADVASVAISPDGSSIASASWDNTLKVWSLKSGKELHTLRGHSSYVTSVAFSPDGSRIASASYDETAKVWDTVSGEELRTFKGHSGVVTSVAFSPDGAQIVSASSDNTAKLWDAATGEELRTLRGHSREVTSVAFSPDGARIASASDDNTVKLWDVASGQELRTLNGHSYHVASVAFSPDGGRIVSASYDQTVRLWDAAPSTPALRVEREARSLVEFYLARKSPKDWFLLDLRTAPGRIESVRKRALELAEEYWSRQIQVQAIAYVERLLGQYLLRAEVVEAIQNDTRLDPDVRTAALLVAESYPEDASKLNASAWVMVRSKGRSSEEYRRALLQAEVAAREWPEDGVVIRTLGVAQFRNGQYQQTVATLNRAEKLSLASGAGPDPFIPAVLAMTYHRLGQNDETQRMLGRLHETMRNPECASNADAQGFLDEVNLLKSQGAEAKK